MPSPDPQLPRIDPERRMGGGDDQAAARQMLAHQIRKTCPGRRHRAPWSARPAARPGGGPSAAGPATAGGAGRRTGRRPADRRHGRARRWRGSRRRHSARRPENRPRMSDSPPRSAPASGRRDGRDSGIAPAASARRRLRPARSCRPPESSRPAISRSSEVLPEPLRPTTATASPEPASKSSPENTSRPPRTQMTPRPESCILPRINPLKAWPQEILG